MPEVKKPTNEDFWDMSKDIGKEPASIEFTEADRQLLATMMASQAAYTQLVVEGIIPPGEELHYQIHFHEFVNKLMKGDDVKLPNVHQTLRINSAVGELYLTSLREAFKRGEEIAQETRARAKKLFDEQMAAATENEQTNKDDENDDLSPRRTLN